MGGWQERTLGSVSPQGLSTAWGPAVSYHGEPGGPALAPSTSVDSRPEPLAQVVPGRTVSKQGLGGFD